MKPNGFSLLELLLVIALVSILAASSIPFLSSSVTRTNARSVSLRVVNSLMKAQSYAKHGKFEGNWGVCSTGGAVRFFRGSCVSPVYYEDFIVPSSVTVLGLTTVTFEKIRGQPNASATITISSAVDSYTITVNSAGLISSN